jgi:hypothetical protein
MKRYVAVMQERAIHRFCAEQEISNEEGAKNVICYEASLQQT